MHYGLELIVDIHHCKRLPVNRKDLELFMQQFCELIDMEREDLVFWDYDDDPEQYAKAPSHLKGTSAVQFIKTSSIVIHTLDSLGKVFVNVFSCKPFDFNIAAEFLEDFFQGRIVQILDMERL